MSNDKAASRWRRRIATGLAALLWGVAVGCERDGLPWDGKVGNGDPYLTQRAATFLPLISAIEAVRVASGRYPASLDELRAPDGALPGAGQASDPESWFYYPLPARAGYTLSITLGRDPLLIYRKESGVGQWVFDPGDGTPQLPLLLEP